MPEVNIKASNLTCAVNCGDLAKCSEQNPIAGLEVSPPIKRDEYSAETEESAPADN